MKKSTVEELITSLRLLPGVGPKTAQRMAFHLLQHDHVGARRLAAALTVAVDNVQHCSLCNTLTEEPVCVICADAGRDPSVLCVVEMPADALMVEQTASYSGFYFVLMGRLSPLDGVGPYELSMSNLLARANNGVVQEVILATNYTNEGDATAYHIADVLQRHQIKTTRIARGLPVGGELEYVDLGTLAQALADRRTYA